MSSKLKRRGYGRPLNVLVELPLPPAQVRAVITLMLRPDGRVDLAGAIANEPMSLEMMRVGLERLKAYHAQKRKDGPGLLGLGDDRTLMISDDVASIPIEGNPRPIIVDEDRLEGLRDS